MKELVGEDLEKVIYWFTKSAEVGIQAGNML